CPCSNPLSLQANRMPEPEKARQRPGRAAAPEKPLPPGAPSATMNLLLVHPADRNLSLQGGQPMTGSRTRWLVLLAFGPLAAPTDRVAAGDLYKAGEAPAEATTLPRPADVTALAVYPARINLRGGDDAQQ